MGRLAVSTMPGLLGDNDKALMVILASIFVVIFTPAYFWGFTD